MNKQLIVDLSTIDFEHVVADIEAIRRYNQQRFEMEQLTAVVHEDTERNICVGYKDVTQQEFWIQGHMPGMPLMPGVMMLEAAAQLCSYMAQRSKAFGDALIGFGGLEDVRFRDPVLPGDRLMLLCEMIKMRRGKMLVCRFQGVVDGSIVVEGVLKGIAIPLGVLKKVEE